MIWLQKSLKQTTDKQNNPEETKTMQIIEEKFENWD